MHAAYEWAAVELFCYPTFVVIHNVNLPGHAGWLYAHLLSLPEWVEVASGYTPHELSVRTAGMERNTYERRIHKPPKDLRRSQDRRGRTPGGNFYSLCQRTTESSIRKIQKERSAIDPGS